MDDPTRRAKKKKSGKRNVFLGALVPKRGPHFFDISWTPSTLHIVRITKFAIRSSHIGDQAGSSP